MRGTSEWARLEVLLPARRGLARKILILETCSSTQDEARSAADPRGALWIAREQSGGRGRRARDWWSGPRDANFATSLTVEPALAPPPATLVAAACALAATLDRFGAGPAAVKWPNDVLLDGAKVAGLLGEWRDGTPPRVLLGIGVNVAAAPPAAAARTPSCCVDEALARRGLPAAPLPLLASDWLWGLERRLARTELAGPADLESEFLVRLRRWAPRGVREPGSRSGPGGPLLEFRFATGLAWRSGADVVCHPLAGIADLEPLP